MKLEIKQRSAEGDRRHGQHKDHAKAWEMSFMLNFFFLDSAFKLPSIFVL